MLNCVPFQKSNRVLIVFLAVALFSLPAFPQGNTGRILGTVTDQSGGYGAGATVIVTNVAQGASRTLVTDSSGAYVFVSLLPGIYKIKSVASTGQKAGDTAIANALSTSMASWVAKRFVSP